MTPIQDIRRQTLEQDELQLRNARSVVDGKDPDEDLASIEDEVKLLERSTAALRLSLERYPTAT